MIVRELLSEQVGELMDIDLRDAVSCILIVESANGDVYPSSFSADGVPERLFQLCQRILENSEAFKSVDSITVDTQ